MRAFSFFIFFCSLTISSAYADASKKYLENEYHDLKTTISARGLNKCKDEVLRFAEILDQEYLVLGQGERELQPENIRNYAAWSQKIKSEIGHINIFEDGYMGRLYQDLPGNPLEIVHHAFAANLRKRRLDVFKYDDQRSWSDPNAAKGFAYFNHFDRELPHILKHTTLNNYPLLFAMLNAEVGEYAQTSPPLLYFSSIFKETMIATQAISPERLTAILALLDHGGWRSTLGKKERLAKDYPRGTRGENYPFFFVQKPQHLDQNASLGTLMQMSEESMVKLLRDVQSTGDCTAALSMQTSK